MAEHFPFFAIISRMKFINRWALMRNTYSENLSEHSLDTAILAHALAVIKNKRFGGNVNAEQAALLAIFHDASEILTGDMPTPVKYFNEEIRSSYKQVEESACARLLSMLPEDLRPEYEPLILHREDQELHSIVKAADKLSALIKCIEERKAGNMEFANAEKATLEAIKRLNLPELNCFLEELLPAYMLTLDEQGMSR